MKMKRKTLLTALVLLSVMQGSVYAAEKITEADFDKMNTYTPTTNEVGAIYIIGNKESDYIINALDNELNITDAEHRGIIVSTENSNNNANMSSLTINGNVSIGDNDAATITPTKELLGDSSYKRTYTSLIQVGQNGTTTNGGRLTINGSLNIQNVDFSNINSLISVGMADNSGAGSSMSVGNIIIDNVKGGTSAGIIELKSTSDKESVNFNTGDIIISNSNVKYGISGDKNVFVETGKITFTDVDFSTSAIDTGNLKVNGNITIQSTDSNGPVQFKESLIDIDGGQIEAENIIIEYAKGMVSGFDANSTVSSLNNITVSNLELTADMNNNSYYDADAAQITNDGSFTVNSINVENILFSGELINQITGINISSTQTDKDILSLTAKNIKSEATTAYECLAGILLENTKMQNVENIKVENITADKVKTYGLYVNEQDLSAGYVDIKDISSIEKNVYGLQIVKGYDSTEEGSNIDELRIEGVTSQNGVAIGLGVNKKAGYDDAKVQIDQLYINDIDSVNKFAAAVNIQQSELKVNQAYINLPNNQTDYGDYSGLYTGDASDDSEQVNNIALRSVQGAKIDWTDVDGIYYLYGSLVAGSGSDSINGGTINIGGKITQIYGDVFAGNGGQITLSLSGADSVLEGQVDDYHELADENNEDIMFHNSAFVDNNGNALDVTSAGNVEINLSNGATWIARGQSFVNDVTLDDGIIDMSKNENSSVTVHNLEGDGKCVMRLDSANRSNSDMLYVTGSLNGNYEIVIAGDAFDINDITEDNPLRFATVKGDVNNDLLKASTTDAGFFNNTYTISKEAFSNGDDNNLICNSSGNGQGVYKPGNDFVESTFSSGDTNLLIGSVAKQTISDAGKTIINMSRVNYNNAIYMDRLNKRMGEARFIDGAEGMWVRLRHDRIGKTDAFRSQNTMYEVGYDLKQACDDGEHRIGMAADYMDGKAEYTGIGGSGDINRYGLWLYDTWLGEKGHYTDYVVKWGHLKNDFDILARSTGEKISGDYSNNVFSASAEYGKKTDLGKQWYIEPQVQLQFARVTEADYMTSQDTRVSLDGINSLIGRAGFRLGKDVDERSTVYLKADVLHEFLGDQDISVTDKTGSLAKTYENSGTWYDVGFGFATAVGHNSYAYLDFEKSFGNDNDETYQINAGLQWSF